MHFISPGEVLPNLRVEVDGMLLETLVPFYTKIRKFPHIIHRELSRFVLIATDRTSQAKIMAKIVVFSS